jgi:RDD family protein
VFVVYAFGTLAAWMGGIGVAVWLILLFALEWLYPIVFELTPSGATPGKRAFHLRVVMDNGLPVTAAASVTRNLLRTADFLPFVYGFAIVSMLVRRDCKRLGDLAAGTIVVYERGAVARPAIEAVEPVAPAFAIAPEDQAALVAFAARAPRLTAERIDELAALAASVSGDRGREGPQVTRRVLGVAQWVLGRR